MPTPKSRPPLSGFADGPICKLLSPLGLLPVDCNHLALPIPLPLPKATRCTWLQALSPPTPDQGLSHDKVLGQGESSD